MSAKKPGVEVPPIHRRLLEEAELRRIADWINQKASAGDPCPVCHSGPSEVQQSLAPLPGGISPDGEPGWLYPCAVTVCVNCGFTRFFNVITMGLLEPYYRKDGKDG